MLIVDDIFNNFYILDYSKELPKFQIVKKFEENLIEKIEKYENFIFVSNTIGDKKMIDVIKIERNYTPSINNGGSSGNSFEIQEITIFENFVKPDFFAFSCHSLVFYDKEGSYIIGNIHRDHLGPE